MNRLIEPYLDGLLSDGERTRFAKALQHDPVLAGEVEKAQMLRRRLGAQPRFRLSRRVTREVMKRTLGLRSRHRQWIGAGAFATAIAVLGLSLQLSQAPDEEALHKARTELAIAFSYLDRIARDASERTSRRVLRDGLSKPLDRGLRDALSAANNEDHSA